MDFLWRSIRQVGLKVETLNSSWMIFLRSFSVWEKSRGCFVFFFGELGFSQVGSVRMKGIKFHYK